MKRKFFTLAIASLATCAYAGITHAALYGNTAPLYLADASSVTQPRIQGMNAAGENQTTIIDSNGNLKIVDGQGGNNAAPQGPSSNNMSNNPGVNAGPNATTTSPTPTTPQANSGISPNVQQNEQPNQDMRPLPRNYPGMVNTAPTNTPNVPTNAPNAPGGVAPNNAPVNMPNAPTGVAPANTPTNVPSTGPNVAPSAPRPATTAPTGVAPSNTPIVAPSAAPAAPAAGR